MTHPSATSPAPPASAPLGEALRVLFVEDDPNDAELEVRALTAAGWDCTWDRVDTEAAFAARLDVGGYDLIISDYNLPTFDGLHALALLRGRKLDVPFVLVSGALGEEAAIESLKLGATDYVLKGRLQRLAPVVRRALSDSEERRQRAHAEAALRASEERYRSLIENAPDVVMTIDDADTFTSLNPAFTEVLGWPRAAWLGQPIAPIVHPDDLPTVAAALRRLRAGEDVRDFSLRAHAAAGDYRVVEITASLQTGNGGGTADVLAIGRDVTARARAEARTQTLFAVAKDLSGTRDLPAALRQVCDRLTAAAPCDVCAVFVSRDGDDAGRLFAQAGLSEAVVQAISTRHLSGGTDFAHALRGGETLVVRDTTAGTAGRELSALGLADSIVVPLCWQERFFGGLVLGSRAPGGLRDDHADLAGAVALQVAAALEADESRRIERDDARVASALARIGQELISSVDLPVMLERLCRVTTEALDCDVSYTLLHDEDTDTLEAVAGHGYPAEHWEMLRALHVPRAAVAALLEPVARDGLLHAFEDREGQMVSTEVRTAFDLRELLAIALRRGDRMVGVHIAGQRVEGKTFSPHHQRIARGIAQLASLALANVRLIDKLEQANRLKADFLATMSHELRTPLNVIIGYNELLLDEVFGALVPEQAASLDRVGTSARELLELINATLDISRLETGRAALSLQEIEAAALLREVEAETHALREKPGVVSRWLVPDDLPPLHSDAVKLKVMLKNLIANAFKFTDAGSVTVEASAADGWFALRVTDTGLGMSAETQAVVFEAFRQGDSSTTRRHGGVGLGLYIVTRLLELLGGHIELTSALGEGSEFRLWVPLDGRRPTPPAAA